MWAKIPDLTEGFLDLVFAPSCLGCGDPIPPQSRKLLVCGTCWTRARPLPSPRCTRCWAPRPAWLSAGPRCRECEDIPAGVRAIRSAFVLDGPSRELVHALKYGGWRAVARPMAERMSKLSLPVEVEEEVGLVLPVPLSSVRLRQRGYNQAALLAHELASFRGWKDLPDLLDRTRSTETQTNLHPAQRRANVAGAFTVPPRHADRIMGEHVMLVDDVWTTGATTLACADALFTGGARAVSVITFARALPELDR